MHDCLSDKDIQAFVEGREDLDVIERHIALCRECRSKATELCVFLGEWGTGRNVPGQPEILARKLVESKLKPAQKPITRFLVPAAIAAGVAVIIGGALIFMKGPGENPAGPGPVAAKPTAVTPPPAPPPVVPKPVPTMEPDPIPTPTASAMPLPPEPSPTAEPDPQPSPLPPIPKPTAEPEPSPVPPVPVPTAEPKPSPGPNDTKVDLKKSPVPTRVIAARGPLKVQHKGGADGERAWSRAALVDGDHLTSGTDGVRAKVDLPDGSSVSFNSGTEVEFTRISEMPHVIELIKGEIAIESSGREGNLTVRAAGREISAAAAFFGVKGSKDEATMTFVTGKASVDGTALDPETQVRLLTKGAEPARKVPGAALLTKWSDSIRAVVFRDDFEPDASSWLDKAPTKFFKVNAEGGQLIGKNNPVDGELKSWGYYSRPKWKLGDQPLGFGAVLAQDRVKDLYPKVEIVGFGRGGEPAWRLVWTLWFDKDALYIHGAGHEREAPLWKGTTELKPGVPRRVEIILDPLNVTLMLDGVAKYKGAHGIPEIGEITFGLGQEGKVDRQVSEVRFEQVEVRKIAK